MSPTTSDDKQVLSLNSSTNVGNNNIVYRTMSCTTTPELLEEIERLRKENMRLNHKMGQLKSLCNNILTLMTNDSSGFSRQLLESSTSVVRTVLVSEGKALEHFLAKLVSSVDDVVHVGGATNFLPCTIVNAIEAEVPKMLEVSIGLKRCKTECNAEQEGNEMRTRALTQVQTQSSQEPDKHDSIREKVLDNTVDALEVHSEENVVDIFTISFSKTFFIRNSGLRGSVKNKIDFLDYL